MATRIIGARARAPAPQIGDSESPTPALLQAGLRPLMQCVPAAPPVAQSDQVRHVAGAYKQDEFYGSKAALIGACIAREGEFPGDPGRGRTAVTIRSELPGEEGEGPYDIPGYRTIRRSGDAFCISMTVDRETQAIRRGPSEPPKPVEYRHQAEETLEFWTGTKEQLQAAGIGVGVAFPGEPGASGSVYVSTPLGLRARLWKSYERDAFCASAKYRPVEECAQALAAFNAEWISTGADGVKTDRSSTREDTFTGSAAALCARGLARTDEFPGAPGRGKVLATYNSDGTPILKGGNGCHGRVCGWRQIKRIGANSFCIRIHVSAEEVDRRGALHDAFEAEQLRLDRQAAERGRGAARAAKALKRMPKTAEEFRRHVATNLRTILRTSLDWVAAATDGHGFSIDPEPIAMSFDAVVEAVLRADVKLDAALQLRVEQQHRVGMAAADPAFRRQMNALTQPNPALLAGEQP